MKRALLWVAVSSKQQSTDERDSLPAQERDLRALAEKQNWNVLDVLTVPGHSRRYVDIYECARDMQAQGIDAFHKLLHYWEQQSFDVLAVRDSSRFGRTQSLHAYVVERTITNGAEIYSLADGLVSADNYRMFIAMAGYSAAGEIDRLVKLGQMGFDARVRRGLPSNNQLAHSHKLIRDTQSGKAIRVEVDESRTQEWHDLAALVLEGIPYKKLEKEMFARFGYASPLGQPYQPHHYYKLLATPSFWGHLSRHYKLAGHGPWTREQGHDIPDGILVEYDKIPPALTGELADSLKAEMTRRENLKGKARPQGTRMFSGLLVCDSCGFILNYAGKGDYHAYRCWSKYETTPTRESCADTKMVNEKKVIAKLKAMLQTSLDNDTPLFANTSSDDGERQRLQTSITELEKQIRVMIGKQAASNEALRDSYDSALEDAARKLKAYQARLKALGAQVNFADTQQRALDSIRSAGDDFWKGDERAINQQLARLLGNLRIVCSEGNAIGVRTVRKARKRY